LIIRHFLFFIIYINFLFSCDRGEEKTVHSSRGIFQLTLPSDLTLITEDSSFKTPDGKTKIYLYHFSKKDSSGTQLSAEDATNQILDSLIFENNFKYVSKPVNRYSGHMPFYLIIAAQSQELLKKERIEIVTFDSPLWIHIILIHLKGPEFSYNRPTLDEIYESATERVKNQITP